MNNWGEIATVSPVTLTDDEGPLKALSFGGWVLPPDELHLQDWMANSKQAELVDGRLSYQYNKIKRIDGWVPEDRRVVCVDIGAHVGLWAVHLAKRFSTVFAFEPHPLHYRLLEWNLKNQGVKNVSALKLGISDHATMGTFCYEKNSSGGTYIKEAEGVAEHEGAPPWTWIYPLDYALKVGKVDLIKIDVEGMEAKVIKGARETLKRCKPYVIVEQKGRDASNYKAGLHEARRILEDMGWHCDFALSGDCFMSPPSA